MFQHETQIVMLDASAAVVQFAANWLVQSALLIAIGLAMGRLVARRGSAAQSAVYRTTLAAVLVCPLATWLLSAAGATGWSLAMPRPWTFEPGAAIVVESPQPIAAAQPVAPIAAPLLSDPTIEAIGPADRSTFAGEPTVFDAMAESAGEPARFAADAPAATPTPALSPPEPVESSEPVAALLLAVHPFGWLAAGLSAVWLLVSLVLVGRLAMAWWQLGRLRRGAVPACDANPANLRAGGGASWASSRRRCCAARFCPALAWPGCGGRWCCCPRRI